MIRVKRVYEPSAHEDGTRVLVDRLWPRGLTKAQARVDLWLKDIAPSNALRKWYHADPARWAEFKKRYFAELDANPAPARDLAGRTARGRVTLLFSSKELERNNAAALLEYLQRKAK